jgi:uncharacterized surface protein with fasciclin (FAS1) repeats
LRLGEIVEQAGKQVRIHFSGCCDWLCRREWSRIAGRRSSRFAGVPLTMRRAGERNARAKVSAITKNFAAKPAPEAAVAQRIDSQRSLAALSSRRRAIVHRASISLRETSMSKRIAVLAAAFGAFALTSALVGPGFAQDKMNEKTVMVGGAPMYPSKDIVDNAVNSKDHTTLVAAVKAAGLVSTLKSAGPFTVFAPTNEAFSKLPAGTVDTLLKPENKAKLTGVLTYHVVPGRISAVKLMKEIKDGGGSYKAKTVEGEELTFKSPSAGKITVTDAKGDTAMVTIADVNQSNGVIHVIDTVLLPAS